MTVDTIKDFLVSLGFEIDDAGKNKFDAVLKGVTANVIRLGAKVEGAALAVLGFTTQAASGLDRLYWASQRTGATATGIKALGYAAAQTGISADAAISSLENLSRFMRNNPGAEGFLNRLGIQTRDDKGQMLDTAAIFTGVGQRLSQMPYYRANLYAQMLGIDENTLMAMRRGLNGFAADYQSMMQKTGFNANRAAEQSSKFMTSMKGLTSLMGILRDKIGSNLAGGLSGSIDSLKKRILDNFPKIEDTLTKIIKAVLWLANAFTRMAYRAIQAVGQVIDWWKNLSDGGKRLIGVLGGLLVAWKVLNSAFIKSPIGLITALIVSLGLLYDDYMTWKEGGNSLIDWSKWEPNIKKLQEAILWIRDKFIALKDAVGGWKNVLIGIGIFMGGTWLKTMMGPLNTVVTALKGFPAIFTGAMTASGLYVVIASINEAYQRMLALRDGRTYGAIASHSEEMTELERLKRRNWAVNNPGIPYPEDEQQRQLEPEQHAQVAKKYRNSSLLNQMSSVFSNLEKLYNLPMGLLRGVAMTESAGNPNAISTAGAKGLFQFMDATAREMGLFGNDVFDPMKAAVAAAKYLNRLLNANGGDLDKALASYNWGIGNVQKYGMALMPQETRNYIPRVKQHMAASHQIQQQNTYNIYGGNSVEIGQEVERRQLGVNAQIMRNMQGRSS
ncbi:transglycosylase SLT domain-containing protein [Yersinia enterocolitica]|uniref:lytic transglycosylase domain-containing protein n=1 Tax=Yersinia enterocolitica TaxID=630 RepID=UPI0005E71564|nr:lytic transglycosylase domain-containing protein [Yersinia enterocolitica]CNK98238.1 membrane-bound lytic murein transglycosylase D [Yersinia enterocolitica]